MHKWRDIREISDDAGNQNHSGWLWDGDGHLTAYPSSLVGESYVKERTFH